MNEHWFEVLRNIGVGFAAAMLVKYYIFLLLAPFHPVKEARRKRRLARAHDAYKNYNPRVSVVVPAWNEEVGIIRTIQSLLRNTYKNLEIIVVNDGSTDNSHRLMLRFQQYITPKLAGSPVRLRYYFKENGGKGTALNTGIQNATGDIIVTMDADSVFDRHAIANLVRYFRDPRVDAAVGNVKVSTGPSLIGRIQALEYLFGFYYKRAHSVMGAEYIFGGACAAFRRSTTFDSIGLFDHGNKTEDIEMSMRTRYHGLRSVYAEDVVCYTEGASTVTGLLNQRLRWKKGRFDTFGKYRRFFFSRDPRHNKALAWFVMPYALLAELQLLFEPIGFALLFTYSFLSGDFISIALGLLFVFITYIVVGLFSQDGINFKLIASFPFTWPLFYFLVWVEYVVLLKSLAMITRGDDIQWQRWERKGVSA